ncbi:MAG: hypothetical protein V9E83_03750 [Baekduia sp.]
MADGLVGGEDAVDLAAEAVEQVLRGPVGGVARGAGVLVARDDRDAGELLLDRVEEPGLALLRAVGAGQHPAAG